MGRVLRLATTKFFLCNRSGLQGQIFKVWLESPNAGGNYTTINAGLIRLQNLPGDWSAVLNANGQWASEPLISNEEFALGGTAGVRGYQEGEDYGDTGWRTQFDLRALRRSNVGYFPTAKGDVPANLRMSWFMDYGQIYLLDRPQQVGHELSEWGTGIGFYLTAGEHFDARLTLGWALGAHRAIPWKSQPTGSNNCRRRMPGLFQRGLPILKNHEFQVSISQQTAKIFGNTETALACRVAVSRM